MTAPMTPERLADLRERDARLSDVVLAQRPPLQHRRELLAEVDRLQALVAEVPAVAGPEICCSWGCGSGACEICPCCCAGWCIGGRDGIPGTPKCEADVDPETVAHFWAEAAEHDPIAALAMRATALLERITGGDFGELCDHPDDCACTAAQAIRLIRGPETRETWPVTWHEPEPGITHPCTATCDVGTGGWCTRHKLWTEKPAHHEVQP